MSHIIILGELFIVPKQDAASHTRAVQAASYPGMLRMLLLGGVCLDYSREACCGG